MNANNADKLIIYDLLKQDKEMNGMPGLVKKSELAQIKCAFDAVKGHYPEKQHVMVLRACCDIMVAAQKKKINTPIALMISQLDGGPSCLSFDDMPASKGGK